MRSVRDVRRSIVLTIGLPSHPPECRQSACDVHSPPTMLQLDDSRTFLAASTRQRQQGRRDLAGRLGRASGWNTIATRRPGRGRSGLRRSREGNKVGWGGGLHWGAEEEAAYRTGSDGFVVGPAKRVVNRLHRLHASVNACEPVLSPGYIIHTGSKICQCPGSMSYKLTMLPFKTALTPNFNLFRVGAVSNGTDYLFFGAELTELHNKFILRGWSWAFAAPQLYSIPKDPLPSNFLMYLHKNTIELPLHISSPLLLSPPYLPPYSPDARGERRRQRQGDANQVFDEIPTRDVVEWS
uniref:Uncharacterized protein n=1 Tax=Oryza punctata TaxID=4537 RepID=A0A0E0KN64_ORYPU